MTVQLETRPHGADKASAPSRPPQQAKKVAKWLCCASGKGGVGKTTTSLNLAVYAVHDGLTVCLVDFDIQGTLTRWVERRQHQAGAPECDLWKGPFTEIEKAIAEIGARDDLDLVVVDTPPAIELCPTAIHAMLRKADFVLVPTTQGTADLDSVIEWMRFLHEEHARAAFLLNRTMRATRSFRSARNRLIKSGSVCPTDIRQLDDILRTHDHGVGVLEMSRSTAAEDYQGLWDFMRKQLGIA
jgi:chromosome partitioning protein